MDCGGVFRQGNLKTIFVQCGYCVKCCGRQGCIVFCVCLSLPAVILPAVSVQSASVDVSALFVFCSVLCSESGSLFSIATLTNQRSKTIV